MLFVFVGTRVVFVLFVFIGACAVFVLFVLVGGSCRFCVICISRESCSFFVLFVFVRGSCVFSKHHPNYKDNSPCLHNCNENYLHITPINHDRNYRNGV